MSLDEIGTNSGIYDSIQGTVVFTRNSKNDELMLFQDFTRSKVIDPGRFLHYVNNSYSLTERPGFLIDRQLSAVFLTNERKLLFRNFRAVNSFLPIFEFYKKASAQEIRELLRHKLFVTKDPDMWAKTANQWFRTRFSF